MTIPYLGKAEQQKAAKKVAFGRWAWRLLWLAVLWARRGSAAHRLRFLSTLRRCGLGIGGGRNDRPRYGECEFSIDKTPAFRFRTPSARVLRLIPCIGPAVPDTPSVYGDDRYFFCSTREREVAECCVGYYDAESNECDGEEGSDGGADEQLLEWATMEEICAGTVDAAKEGEESDSGVDVKAEEFIAKFHSQMKPQRQISWLQYNEMMKRSLC